MPSSRRTTRRSSVPDPPSSEKRSRTENIPTDSAPKPKKSRNGPEPSTSKRSGTVRAAKTGKNDKATTDKKYEQLAQDFKEHKDKMDSAVAVLKSMLEAMTDNQSAISQPPIEKDPAPIDVPNVVDIDAAEKEDSGSTAPNSGKIINDTFSSLPAPTRLRVSGLTKSALPVSAHIKEKVKKQIWDDEYIDIGLCLPRLSLGPDEYSLSFKNTDIEAGGTPVFSFAPKQKVIIHTHAEWQRAFEAYAAVVLEHPDRKSESEGLFKYIQTIRDLSEMDGDWKGYDESFRSFKKSQGWSWEDVPGQLYFSAALSAHKKKSNGRNKGAPSASSSKSKHCFKFNEDRPHDSSTCHYPHVCKWCDGKHSGARCWQKHGKTPRQNHDKGEGRPGNAPHKSGRA